MLVVVVIAACVYFIVRAMDKRKGAGGGGTPAKPGPVGPDDDPDFLWDLNKKIKDPRRTGGTGSRPAGQPPTEPTEPQPEAPDEDTPRS